MQLGQIWSGRRGRFHCLNFLVLKVVSKKTFLLKRIRKFCDNQSLLGGTRIGTWRKLRFRQELSAVWFGPVRSYRLVICGFIGMVCACSDDQVFLQSTSFYGRESAANRGSINLCNLWGMGLKIRSFSELSWSNYVQWGAPYFDISEPENLTK